ncbi:unnamed protein product [Debaryomyces fabryi]|nr:unnamed protein product [Debaryomyces fabryi]
MSVLIKLGAVVCIFCIIIKEVYARFQAKKTASAVNRSTDEWIFANRIPAVFSSFKWRDASPIKYRPFVGTGEYKMTMKIKNLSKTPEEWLLIEDTYLNRTDNKAKIVEEYFEDVIYVNHQDNKTVFALREYYDFCLRFLQERYPQYFKVVVLDKNKFLHNIIRDEKLPLDSRLVEPQELCKILSRTLEEDFLILLKDNPTNPDEEYKLKCSSWCFPSGFSPKDKFEQSLSAIHYPVPDYASKLKLSMNKFFERVCPKDLWMRTNWLIQLHPNLMSINTNHASKDEVVKSIDIGELDFDNCFLRCERQVITCLPILNAKVMTIRTYTTPLLQIKAEGLGNELIQAIDGLNGDFAHYKNKGAWGQAVKQYMGE